MGSTSFAIIVSVVCFCLLIYPFFAYGKEKLNAVLSYDNLEQLKEMQQKLLTRYIMDEKAHAAGDLTASAWKSRRAFLVARYVDAGRRIDFLKNNDSLPQS